MSVSVSRMKLLLTILLPLTVSSLYCSKDCRPDTACCSESVCANNPADDNGFGECQDYYLGSRIIRRREYPVFALKGKRTHMYAWNQFCQCRQIQLCKWINQPHFLCLSFLIKLKLCICSGKLKTCAITSRCLPPSNSPNL